MAAADIAERVVADWRLEPGPAAAALVAAGAYLAGLRRAARWPAARTLAFLGGLAVLVVATQSGLESHGEELLSVHMVQHLLLVLVVPPLLVLGAPVRLALRSVPLAARRSLVRALGSGPVRTLTRPAVALALFALVLVGSHAPPVYDAALRSAAVHAAEHAAYLGAGLVFWLPVTAAEPFARPPSPLGRILLLLLVMPPMTAVGVTLLNLADVAYPTYLATADEWGVSALDDQQAGGRIMWWGGNLALVAASVAVGWAALLEEERRQRMREAYAERGPALPGGSG